ncbi:MAG: SRPBCC domain-containing protein [Pseudomonadota bacterium]
MVYSAWTDPDRIENWFGPEGMTIATKEINLNPGGVWGCDTVVSDGSRSSNKMVFLRLGPPTLLEVEYGSDQDNDRGRFRMLVPSDAQSDGKTVLARRQMPPSKERRQGMAGIGAAREVVAIADVYPAPICGPIHSSPRDRRTGRRHILDTGNDGGRTTNREEKGTSTKACGNRDNVKTGHRQGRKADSIVNIS